MKCKCQKCGYEWEARKDRPKACPECKTRSWDATKNLQSAVK